MAKYRVDWTEYHSAVVEADNSDEAHEKVHNTEEYDKDNSLVDMSTTEIVNIKDECKEVTAA